MNFKSSASPLDMDMAMNSHLPKVCFIAAISLFTTAAHSGSPRSVDARSLDIAGVRTGMSYDEALKATAKHFDVSIDKIRTDAYPPVNQITGTNLPVALSYESNGVSMMVNFVARVPVDMKDPLVVWAIKYEIPWSAENKAAMEDAVLAKYGQPSSGTIGASWLWCAHHHVNPGMGCRDGEAKLHYFNTHLDLKDPAYHEAVRKHLDAKKAVKPKF